MSELIELTDRTIIRLSGEDARSLLQGIITTDANKLSPDHPLFACILTPQGKWLHEFFVIDAGDAILLDTHSDAVEPLMKTLKKYRLRAKVEIAHVEEYSVAAIVEGDAPESDNRIIYRDPRHAEMGWRVIVTTSSLGCAPAQNRGSSEPHTNDSRLTANAAPKDNNYAHHRLCLGIPDGAYDANESSLPIELGYDLLSGIDFEKGCYVGQEVTARMHYRKVRRRIPVMVRSNDAQPLPPAGTTIFVDGTEAGDMRSSAGDVGLAVVKSTFSDTGHAVQATVANHTIILQRPDWLKIL